MTTEITVLLTTAASLGFLHTVLGPDHYLPFVAMSKSGNWSFRKTTLITFLCGVGHVLGSMILGAIGIAVGITVNRLEMIESMRGNIAAWVLLAFGLLYTIWGIRRAVRNRPHTHVHPHADGTVHAHNHQHRGEHAHPHPDKVNKKMTPWVLFVIFVLGPCEALIPVLMYPAARESYGGLISVTLVFGITTVITMLGMVWLFLFGLQKLPFKNLERYTHALAGFTIFLAGAAIQFLGL